MEANILNKDNLHPQTWDLIIEPKNSLLQLGLKDVWRYRDLLWIMVRRDIVVVYKQTVLGPVWFFIQPLFTMIIFTVVFSNIAGIGTGGVPAPLFYLAGLTFWNYFSLCLTTISTTFVTNSQLFGKVYFPRLVAPFSVIISNVFKLGIQFILFIGFWLYYYLVVGFEVDWMWVLPGIMLVTLIFGLLSLGFGLIVTALTTKYRDFYFLVQFGVQLLMYLTPVIYSVGTFPAGKQWIIWINPLSAPIEAFRFWCIGAGVLDWGYMAYSLGFSFAVVLIGIVLFNRVEKDFTDTV